MITGLERSGRGRSKVTLFVDGDFFRILPERLSRQRRLAIGAVITPTELQRLSSDIDREEAVDAALSFLSYRPRSRAEVERHLRKRGHAGEHVDAAVRRCRQLGYIDDRAFAVAWARQRIRLKPRGRVGLVSELAGLGIGRDLAEAAVEEALCESGVSEADLLAAAAEKRWRLLVGLETATARRRLTAYLTRRGFPPAAIRAVVAELTEREPEPPA